ncbi:unnamed protein product [Phytophthora lilii]|uniref:Unnamed protein product n=1 Tax=Phytophthora lilii TaxID=2077276 RepID=A0A9W6TTI0_9STRA|nr:unnamed protein product [Phytophthora lilii]
MSSITNEGFDPLGPFEPPLSPTMERAFSEAFADISELDDQVVIIKVEAVAKSPGSDASANLRMATPPSSVSIKCQDKIGGMSPSEKEPAIPKDSAEAKRARRSAIEKKSRQRRQGILKRMREEVKQLENVYAEMARKLEAGHLAGLVQGHNGFGTCGGSSSMDELQQKYSELTLVAHALEEDQVALQKLLQEHECFNRTVRSLSDEMRAEDQFVVWDSGIPPSSSFTAKFRPLTMAEGYALVRESYEEIRKFTECENFETTGASFMGWTDKRKYDRNLQALQYSFTKQFPFERAEDVFKKSWDTFLDGPKLENLAFDNSAQSRFQVLQVLNDDFLVIRRDHRMPRFPMTFTSVQILFRLQTPTGYTLCIRTILSPEIKSALEPHEYLIEIFHWYVLSLF